MSVLSGEGKGGADRLALDVSKGLRRRGHRVIWAAPPFCCLREEAKTAGLEVFDLYPTGRIDMAGLPGLLKFCKDERVDILNAHHSHGRHMLLIAKLRGIKSRIVFTRHCKVTTVPYIGAFHSNLFVDMNLAVSGMVLKSLIRSGIMARKARMIYGGVDIARFENVPPEAVRSARKSFGKENAFNIGIVARFSREKNFSPEKRTMKGHEFLFRALSTMEDDFNVLVAGVWGERHIESLRLVAAHNGLSPLKLSFCGFQNDVAPLYKIMDLAVLPSSNEGLGLTLIEAMAAGVPCIGTDSGGIREIIDNGTNGLLFRPGDAGDLAAKIRILRDNREVRDTFISNGRKKVRGCFDMEQAVLKTENVFYELSGAAV